MPAEEPHCLQQRPVQCNGDLLLEPYGQLAESLRTVENAITTDQLADVADEELMPEAKRFPKSSRGKEKETGVSVRSWCLE